MRCGVLAAAVVAAVFLSAAPAAAHMQKPGPRLKKEVFKHWKKPAERRMAFCISFHESRYREKVVSRTGDYGAFQINRQAHGGGPLGWMFTSGKILTYRWNVNAAKRIYDSAVKTYGWSGRWTPWAARHFC